MGSGEGADTRSGAMEMSAPPLSAVPAAPPVPAPRGGAGRGGWQKGGMAGPRPPGYGPCGRRGGCPGSRCAGENALPSIFFVPPRPSWRHRSRKLLGRGEANCRGRLARFEGSPGPSQCLLPHLLVWKTRPRPPVVTDLELRRQGRPGPGYARRRPHHSLWPFLTMPGLPTPRSTFQSRLES